MRSAWKPVVILMLGAAVLAGCGPDTAEVQFVNISALSEQNARRRAADLLLARSMLPRLIVGAQDYTVGPGDQLEISVFEWEVRDLAKTAVFRVSNEGLIAPPLVGDLRVEGMSAVEIKKAIEARLRDGGFLKEPQVAVKVREFFSKRVAVLGAVNTPGIHALQQNVTTLLDAISESGGVRDSAGYLAYVIFPPLPKPPVEGDDGNGDQGKAAKKAKEAKEAKDADGGGRLLIVDLYELMECGNLESNVVLPPDTIVNIPEAGKFSVIGFVNKPGSFPLTRPVSVLEAVAMAGGLIEKQASPDYCLLKRVTPEGERMIPVDLLAISEGDAENFMMQPGDVVRVRQHPSKKYALEVWNTFKQIFNLSLPLR